MTQAPPKRDRRVERTHQLLSQALMELIIERGYESITIQDIADRADVSRTTFYLHFKDKDELLFTSMQGIYDGLVGNHQGLKLTEIDADHLDDLDCKASDWEHVAEFADFYRVMLSDKGSIRFAWEVLSYLSQLTQSGLERQIDGQNTQLPLDFVSAFLSGAQIGVTKWWIENDDMQTPPEEIARMHFLLASLGLRWALSAKSEQKNAQNAAE